MSSIVGRVRELWRTDPKGMSLDLLRVGIGIVWALNLVFILAPSNQYFAGFQSVASGFQPTSLGGPGLAGFVAAHPQFFSWTIALLTAYLAVAFLAGFTTRLACFVGEVASAGFLITQFGSTFSLNGAGTDVGPHPLYILVYLILFAGGAGQYVAVDHWIWKTGRARLPRLSQWLASPYLVGPNAVRDAPRPAPALPTPSIPARAGLSDQAFFNAVAVVAVLVVLGGFAAAYAGSAAAPSAAPPPAASEPSRMYLTVVLNPTTGMPQYSPSNFTVPKGLVEFTIIDQDAPVAWSACTCNVTGTVGGTETWNGSAVTSVSSSNAAHTFTIPSLGLNVITPGGSTITFTVDLNQTGSFTWFCMAPCGSAGYTGPPMAVPGYMTGTMNVQ